jgi:hypothetical protein
VFEGDGRVRGEGGRDLPVLFTWNQVFWIFL